MSERGVFAVDRGIWDHPMFASRQPLSRREAWLWLLSSATWKAKTVFVDRKRVTLSRGQLAFSVRFMADQWGWSKSAVSRFLGVLKTETMIDAEAGQSITIITICKYDEYQRVSLPDRDTNRDIHRDDLGTLAGHSRDKEEDKEDKEDKEEKKETREVALSDGWSFNSPEDFWLAWPNKVGKPAAMKALASARKRGASFDAILAGIGNYIRDKPPDRPWLNPATFLNQNRWEDRPATLSSAHAKPKNPIIQAIDDLGQRIAGFDGPPRADDGLRGAEGEAPPRLLSHG